MKVEGYVIVAPKRIGMKDPFYPHYHSFSSSPAYAWRYFIGFNVHEMDVSDRIQACHDNGYRVKKATMEIEE